MTTEQLSLGISERLEWEAQRKRADILERSIARKAWRIHRNSDVEQDIRILCPISADGVYCEWVAGHYGGHNLNRTYKQRRYE